MELVTERQGDMTTSESMPLLIAAAENTLIVLTTLVASKLNTTSGITGSILYLTAIVKRSEYIIVWFSFAVTLSGGHLLSWAGTVGDSCQLQLVAHRATLLV